jgi:heat shock protein HtpX
MAMMKRVFLFLAVNFLVVLTISVVMSVLGVTPYMTAYGIDFRMMAVTCLIWGMGGAFISLLLSRVMAKWMMGVKVIDPDTRDPEAQELVQTVHQLARSAGLGVMPEVGIYDSRDVNAFATGPTKNRSLVAVSTGLLRRMDRDARDGVLGHEVAHIANGDMVTMTLIQGVVNAFVMFLSRALAFAIAQALAGNRDRDRDGGAMSPMVFHLVRFVLEIFLMILGSLVVAWFSRWREYRADAGGARLAGRDKMVHALQSLQRTIELVDPDEQAAVATLKISGRRSRFLAAFSTHPPLEERILRLSKGL